jgi:serine/threonine protein kinase/tetratricopeptide (TPR) repeat protein/class 3 adenylate cyclase
MSIKDDPLIGRKLHGTIEIIRRIGEGGMGYVYEAYQAHLERRLAVKVMTPEHARNPVASEYFIREAKSASRLRHPNIIQIIDFGKEDDETLFLAMEFIPGRPLTDILAEEFPLTPKRVANILTQTLSGLEEAHAQGIVHRDLKPDNLMVERTRSKEDFVKILDFGIAHLRSSEAKAGPLTQQGAVIGTPHYMSPEQARGDRVDARSDLFSIGIILYEMITGELPFTGRSMPEILISIMRDDPIAPSSKNPSIQIDPVLESICLRALKREPELRYPTSRAFIEALAEVGSSASASAPAAKFIFKRPGRRSAAPKPRHERPTEEGVVPGAIAKKKEDFVSQATVAAKPRKQEDRDTDGNVIDIEGLFSSLGSDAPELEEDALPLGVDPPPGTQQAWAGAADARHHDRAEFATQAAVPSAHDTNPVPRDTNDDRVTAREVPSPISPDPGGIPPEPVAAFSRLGIDIAELRDDLLGDRRNVTVLVIHQRVHHSMDPEDLLELHEHLDHQLAGLMEQWQGRIQQRQGGYVTCMFGFDAPRTDDAFRATQCALVVRKQLRRFTPEQVAYGFALSQGEIFAPGGDLARAAGLAIDNATERSRQAADDEVLVVGEDFQDQLSSTFRMGAKTGTGDCPVLGVLDIDQASLQSDHADLIGRDREIAGVLGALGRLGRQQGAIMGITGDGGVGKSALVREAISLAEPRDVLVLRARWRGYAAGGILEVVRQWISDLLRQTGRTRDELLVGLHEQGLSAEYARLLDGLMRERLRQLLSFKGQARAMGGESSTERAIEAAFRKLVDVLVEQRPLMLTIDEVSDDGDGSISNLLERWKSFIEQRRLLLVVAMRTYPGKPHPIFPNNANLLHLDVLANAASQAYLKLNLPADTPDALCNKLARLGAGNPLQLEQLAKFVNAQPEASYEEIEQRLAEARGVKQLMQMRLFGLERNAQNILGLLAGLGDGADVQAIFDLAAPSWEPEDTLQYLYDEGVILVEETDLSARLYFMPPALGKIVYQSMSKKARVRTHERALHYLEEVIHERGGDATREELLAIVAQLEALERFEDASKVLHRLKQQAMLSFEYESAEQYLLHNLKVTKRAGADNERRLLLKLELARVMHAQGRTKEALDVVVKLDRLKELSDALAHEIRLELATMWLDEEDPVLLEKVLKPLISQVRNASNKEFWILVRATQMLATVYEKQNKLAAAMRLLLDAIDETEKLDISATENPWGPSLLWEPLNQLGRLRLKDGDIAGAQKMFQLALNVVGEAEDIRGEINVRANMATMFIFQNRLEDAYRCIQTSIKLARRTGQMRTLAKLQHNRGLLHLRQRRAEVAREAFEESAELSRALDWREGIAMNVSQLRNFEDKAQNKRDREFF